jgi:hypothetical protein
VHATGAVSSQGGAGPSASLHLDRRDGQPRGAVQ